VSLVNHLSARAWIEIDPRSDEDSRPAKARKPVEGTNFAMCVVSICCSAPVCVFSMSSSSRLGGSVGAAASTAIHRCQSLSVSDAASSETGAASRCAEYRSLKLLYSMSSIDTRTCAADAPSADISSCASRLSSGKAPAVRSQTRPPSIVTSTISLAPSSAHICRLALICVLKSANHCEVSTLPGSPQSMSPSSTCGLDGSGQSKPSNRVPCGSWEAQSASISAVIEASSPSCCGAEATIV
jgi:hypothetical protein